MHIKMIYEIAISLILRESRRYELRIRGKCLLDNPEGTSLRLLQQGIRQMCVPEFLQPREGGTAHHHRPTLGLLCRFQDGGVEGFARHGGGNLRLHAFSCSKTCALLSLYTLSQRQREPQHSLAILPGIDLALHTR